MQPYLFPYLGYFQLIARSDRFVFLDDVQYIKRGWANRNRILFNGQPRWIRIPVESAPRHESFAQRRYIIDARVQRKILGSLWHAYRSAPHFERIYSLVKDILEFEDWSVSQFNIYQIRKILQEIGIKQPTACSSEQPQTRNKRGQDRILALCKAMDGDAYINLVGGINLYSYARFEDSGIELKFLIPRIKPYRQSGNEFVPDLSIIDVLMWCSVSEVREKLREYRLVSPEELV